MRFVDLFNAISSGGAPAAERHYLQFNGTSDYAVADAVFGGISGNYTIAIKVAGRCSVDATRYYYHAGKDAVANVQRDRCRQSTTSLFFSGSSESGTTQYSLSGASTPADTAARIIAVRRESAGAGAARVRCVKASGAEYSAEDLTATWQKPEWLAVGALMTDSTTAAGSYGDVALIGLVLASVQIPDAELTAWLNATTAIGNITGIDHYWVASDISGASIPARVGTVALALTGPTSSDLVAWSPS